MASKFILIVDDETNSRSYIDISTLIVVHIRPFITISKEGRADTGYRAIGVNSIGQEFILTSDAKSGKPDQVINWVTENIIKVK